MPILNSSRERGVFGTFRHVYGHQNNTRRTGNHMKDSNVPFLYPALSFCAPELSSPSVLHCQGNPKRLGSLLNKVETDQAIEEPAEIMHINQDSESKYEKSVRPGTFSNVA
ncbi:hypothetical protein TNCV_1683961 [Trichonephila clavipes]|nr:hypothetical protein TNCV_1683961 [Trichonephila clavipes]